MPQSKFKYTVRRNNTLYVVFPIEGRKYPVWKICRDESQKGVDSVIRQIKKESNKHLPSYNFTACGELFDFWLETVRKTVSARTFQTYENNIDRYLRPAFAKRKIIQLKSDQIQNMFDSLIERGLTAQTIKKVHQILSMIFNTAKEVNMISENPVKPLQLFKTGKENNMVKIMRPDEAERFINQCEDSPLGIVFQFALDTGMRPGEYLALRWTDIDLNERTAKVSRALVYDKRGGGFYFNEVLTKQAHRVVSFTAETCEALKKHRDNQNALIEEIEERIRGHFKPSREHRRKFNKIVLKNFEKYDLVFSSSDFTPFKETNLSRRYFKNILEMSGLDDFTLYSLRYTCIYRLIRENTNPVIINQRLGYATFSWADNVYAQIPVPDESLALEDFFASLNGSSTEGSDFIN